MTREMPDIFPSPLELVRIGHVTLDEAHRLESVDVEAASVIGQDERAVRGQLLVSVIVPEGGTDDVAVAGPPPFSYKGLSRASGALVLVRVSSVPQVPLVASLVSVNEYLAESQALARVKLRHTIESIIAGFAHEVRNPLAAILSLSEAALLDEVSLDSPLVRIPGLVSRVEALIKQALSYSRPRPPRRALHQAATLLDHVLSLVRQRPGKTIEVSPVAARLPPVMVDLSQVEQALMNLVDNALDAANSAVRLTVRSTNLNVPAVCIEVVDDGPGVPADIVTRIFDPFFTTKAQGTGLGLAIARDLSRLNGGDLRCVARPGQGASFHLYLPSTASAVRGAW